MSAVRIPSSVRRRLVRAGIGLLALGVGAFLQWSGIDLGGESSGRNDEGARGRIEAGSVAGFGDDDVARIASAFETQTSGFVVEVAAEVKKTLPDDTKGSQHQRFLIELRDGRTLLVAHNIDLADRVPLERGDSIRLRGQFEWNDRGGVLHWTHHDPRGRRPGGWIEHEGRRIK